METKDLVQRKIKDQILTNRFRGIVLSSVRSGKTRILLEAIKEHSSKRGNNIPRVLVLYPNIDIRVSWVKECELINYYPDISYCTFASIHKMKDTTWDYIICDEAQLLGEENQLPIACELSKKNDHFIFASGTYNKETLDELQICSGLDLIVDYNTDSAIKDGIVSDFTIYIHKYSLNNEGQRQFGKTKKWWSTEYMECRRLNKLVENSEGKSKLFNGLMRMRFINSSHSLINKVRKWIFDNPDKRYLLFAPDEKTGLMYNLPMFNSKSKDKQTLLDFQEGRIDKLCLLKKASAGVTFPNLNVILITALNSNGEQLEQQIGRSLLKDTDKSEIHIFVSNQEFQLKWLEKALTNVDKSHIKWV